MGVQVVEVSTCWLRLISPQRTTRTEAAGGRRVTNQIWRNLMLACPWEPRDTRGVPLTYASNTSTHSPSPHTGPIHIRQEIGNIFLAGTINDQRSGLRSAINGFWREPLNIRGNFSPCCESSRCLAFQSQFQFYGCRRHMLGHFPQQ